MEHQAASSVVSADSSCTSRRDMVDAVTHHRQTGIDRKGLRIFVALSIAYIPILPSLGHTQVN